MVATIVHLHDDNPHIYKQPKSLYNVTAADLEQVLHPHPVCC